MGRTGHLPARPRAGRLRVSPWFSVVVLLVAGFTLLRLYERARPGGWRVQSRREEPRTDAPADAKVGGWVGEVVFAGGSLRAQLLPYHASANLQQHRSASLRERLGLDEGELWRLVLTLESDAGGELAPKLSSVLVSDEVGVVITSLAEAARGANADGPLLTLLADMHMELGPGRSDCVVLWGKRPWGDSRLTIVRGDDSLEIVLHPDDVDAASVPRWFRGQHVAKLDEAPDARDREIADLRAELERERKRRQERELEFLDFNRTVAALDPQGSLGVHFDVDPDVVPAEDPEASEAQAADEEEQPVDHARERAQEILVSLRTLFQLEGLRGLDLLETGTLGDGWVGPVVFRILDERGRTQGMVAAQRLRLEASRAARTVTVVLEEGHESRGGEDFPFANGLRRVTLPYVDPEAWFDSVPELFTAEDRSPIDDDGLWNLTTVRKELNRLLGLDKSSGWFRLKALGGVMGPELVDVHIEELDSSGRVKRRIFADRMRVELEEKGVQIELHDGAIVRGEDKESFRGGMHRIYLPTAARKDWESAHLPGLLDPAAETSSDADAEPDPPAGEGS